MRAPSLSKNKIFFGTDDAFSRSVEIVVTPVIFAAIGWLIDRWLETGPWVA
jgi:F0F1-type ATP synthase assembly protein I